MAIASILLPVLHSEFYSFSRPFSSLNYPLQMRTTACSYPATNSLIHTKGRTWWEIWQFLTGVCPSVCSFTCLSHRIYSETAKTIFTKFLENVYPVNFFTSTNAWRWGTTVYLALLAGNRGSQRTGLARLGLKKMRVTSISLKLLAGEKYWYGKNFLAIKIAIPQSIEQRLNFWRSVLKRLKLGKLGLYL